MTKDLSHCIALCLWILIKMNNWIIRKCIKIEITATRNTISIITHRQNTVVEIINNFFSSSWSIAHGCGEKTGAHFSLSKADIHSNNQTRKKNDFLNQMTILRITNQLIIIVKPTINKRLSTNDIFQLKIHKIKYRTNKRMWSIK